MDENRRRWFQFRLRTLLIATLVLSLPLSWFAVRLEKARRQREAVEAIERLNGIVFYEWAIVLPGTAIGSSGTAATPPASTWLRTTLGNDFFDKVAQVEFWDVRGTDADMKHLEVLTDLQFLVIHSHHVTDAGLTHLESLTNLHTLSILCNQITDNGLEYLKGLTNLKVLVIQGPEITDTGLEHLKWMTSLDSLFLGGTEITDTGLENLRGLTNLEELDLGYTKITDAGLEHLEGLTNLNVLHLDNTQVTPEGVKKLQEALPNCKIEY